MHGTMKEPTAMALAFERAIISATGRHELTDAERQSAAEAVTELDTLRQSVADLMLDNQLQRDRIGELESMVSALEVERDNARAEADGWDALATHYSNEYAALQRQVERRKRGQDASVRVWGFAFPGDRIPLPLHFGRTQGDALAFASVTDPDFRETHDDDLELVECEVRLTINGQRSRIRGNHHGGWKRETRASQTSA